MNKQNLSVFIDEAKKFYEASYWRDDEEILANKYFKRGKLLILGCGGGRTIGPLHEKGFDITAIDIVPEMVEETKRKFPNLPVYQMDAAGLRLDDNSFDCVFFPFHGLGYVYPDIYKCVEEAARVLKPNGVAIFNTHNRFYLKRLRHFFKGRYYNDNRLLTYKSTYLDWFKFKKYFNKVIIKQRITLSYWNKSNWKDKLYRLFPIFDKSTYWICIGPK